jgi:hypothetical protein
MMHRQGILGLASAALLTLPLGCGSEPTGQIGDIIPPAVMLEQPFTSDVATLMDFTFDGELTSSSGSYVRGQIRSQLMYTIGSLNAEPGVARLDKAVLSNISTVYIGSGLYRTRYHAMLPVAWGSKTNLPSTYTFTLPRRIDWTGQSSFTSKYGPTCNDGEPQSVTVNNYWYHFRPRASGCSIGSSDVQTMTTTSIVVDTTNTVAKYPEYHKLWEDGALNVVAIFAKYEAGARDQSDAGISAFNEFVQSVRETYPDAETTPASLPDYEVAPDITDVTFQFTRGGGTVTINAFLLEAVTSTSAAWEKRYKELTPGADLILYDGHAGLGANVAALSKKGKFFPQKYQIFMMNGCDTFAYYDNTLPSIRAALNPSDPTGTRYMDFITNAMPAYFSSLATDAMAIINAAVNHTSPTTYQNIFHNMDRVQVVVVTGEEDNVFTPWLDLGISWNGMEEKGAVGKYETVTYQTDVLQPGKYVFTTTPDPRNSGGDADLRVRVGAPPTITSTYKCPSYQYNTNEECIVTVTSPAAVYIAVTGDATGVQSPYILRAWQLAAQ